MFSWPQIWYVPQLFLIVIAQADIFRQLEFNLICTLMITLTIDLKRKPIKKILLASILVFELNLDESIIALICICFAVMLFCSRVWALKKTKPIIQFFLETG